MSRHAGHVLAWANLRNRLKNIEQTEKAKREMMEQRKAAAEGSRKGPQDEDYGAARCE